MAYEPTPNDPITDRGGYVHESPFAELLDMRVPDPDDGTSTVTMPINPGHLQQAGRVQGGIVVALADYAFYRAVKPLLKPGEATTTIEIKVNFLAPAQKGDLTATAKIISAGRRVMVGEMEVKDQDGNLVAQGLGTYLVIPSKTQS